MEASRGTSGSSAAFRRTLRLFTGAKGPFSIRCSPDRFLQSGERCDLDEKLSLATVHDNWSEEVCWQPTPEGLVLNNDFLREISRNYVENGPSGLSGSGSLSEPHFRLSSHRSDTGDYKTPDPMLGTEADFANCAPRPMPTGIRVVLDGGVLPTPAPTACTSTRSGPSGGNGAYCTKDPLLFLVHLLSLSGFYHCWWNFDTCPR